jgi:hypothetical protein
MPNCPPALAPLPSHTLLAPRGPLTSDRCFVGSGHLMFKTNPLDDSYPGLGSRGRRGEGMITRLPSRALKVENDAGGWLGRVRPAIGVQGTESEVRILVHEPSVLSPQRQVARKRIVGASSV